jgi:glycosyltransferase involved in cell wall biosynthesis
MPRVSVIIPAFNADEHIADTIRSIFRQTYGDWEIVIGDDASTDTTVAVARSFGPRVRVLESAINGGPAAAKSLAIAHATGELLAFLDADDHWHASYLEHQVRLYESSLSGFAPVGIVACNARILGSSGFLPGTYRDYVKIRGEVTVARLLAANPILTSALCPRSAVEHVGGFATELRVAEDYDLWLRMVECGYRVVMTDEPLHVYRLRGESLSSDPVRVAVHTQRVYRRALVRGNLSARERRIARRELRRQVAIERVASPQGFSPRGVLRTLPLLTLVAIENPRRWPSFARALASRGRSLTRFGG